MKSKLDWHPSRSSCRRFQPKAGWLRAAARAVGPCELSRGEAERTGLPVKPDAGATTDSDIIVMNLDDFLDGSELPRNLTPNGAAPDAERLASSCHSDGGRSGLRGTSSLMVNGGERDAPRSTQ
jgi:hypothetical protein